MIYVTGDCHGEYGKFSSKKFPDGKEMTRNDYVIVCGDFGYWDKSKESEHWLDWLSEKKFTILWVDGNHENFDMLKELPVKEWNGGKVQFIRDNVIRLMRGQVFELEGKKFFTFGGARSHDIQDGILDPDDPDFYRKYKILKRSYAYFRVNHYSWWKEEMPNELEMAEGLMNLEKVDFDVDYIITHCCSSSIQTLLGGYEPDELTTYFEKIKNITRYDRWYFGHYHQNKYVDMHNICLFNNIQRIV